jgi:Transmembrane secretion effector
VAGDLLGGAGSRYGRAEAIFTTRPRSPLGQDVEEPPRQLESFLVASWAEHERQLERTTHSDGALFARVQNAHTGREEPLVRRLIGRHFRREGVMYCFFGQLAEVGG